MFRLCLLRNLYQSLLTLPDLCTKRYSGKDMLHKNKNEFSLKQQIGNNCVNKIDWVNFPTNLVPVPKKFKNWARKRDIHFVKPLISPFQPLTRSEIVVLCWDEPQKAFDRLLYSILPLRHLNTHRAIKYLKRWFKSMILLFMVGLGRFLSFPKSMSVHNSRIAAVGRVSFCCNWTKLGNISSHVIERRRGTSGF